MQRNGFTSRSSNTSARSAASSETRAIASASAKLAFSMAALAFGAFRLGLAAGELQTLAFVTLVPGNQAVLYVLRERRRMWRPTASGWVLASSVVDIGIVSALAGAGLAMEPLPWLVLLDVLLAAAGFALILDQIKVSVLSLLRIE